MGFVKNGSKIYLSHGEWTIIFYLGKKVIKIYEIDI